MTNEEKIQGLRDLADLLEREPELCEAMTSPTMLYVFEHADTARFARLGLALGNATKGVKDNYYNIEREFGPLTLQVTTRRENVCVKTVVGIEQVETFAPDPEVVAALPKVRVVTEVEKVEWVCPPSLHELAER
jgi:hypothetical protein